MLKQVHICGLSDVNRKQGKVAEALQMEDYCNAYKDSVKRLEQPVEVMASVKDAMMRQTVQHYESFLASLPILCLCIGCCIIMPCLVFGVQTETVSARNEYIGTRTFDSPIPPLLADREVGNGASDKKILN